MTEVLTHNPVGLMIADYSVRGERRDDQDRWVGADLGVEIPPAGTFFLEVVTKVAYAREEREDVLHSLEDPSDLLREPPDEGTREPFVLNDAEITTDILNKKFRGRLVEADLAASLWHEEAVAA